MTGKDAILAAIKDLKLHNTDSAITSSGKMTHRKPKPKVEGDPKPRAPGYQAKILVA